MSDGYHIGLLIMSALHYLAPQFLEEGRLCWLRSPLYIVKNGKEESYYFVMNETDEIKTVSLDKNYYDILNNKTIGRKLVMEPCEFYILKNV